MIKRLPETLSSVLGDIRKSAWPIIVISILYRIIAFVLFVPLVSGVTTLFLAGSGRVVVSNEEIVSFFFEPIGIAAILAISTVSITLIALEQACLMTLAFEAKQTTAPLFAHLLRSVQIMKYVLVRGLGILELSGRIAVKVLLLSTPFLSLAGLVYFLLLTEHDINFYLANEPPVFKWALTCGAGLGIGLAAGLLLLTARVLFALPVLLFEKQRPRKALQKSAALSAGNRRRIAVNVCAWASGSFFAASVAGTLFIWLGKLLAPPLLGNTAVLILVLGTGFLAFSLAQLLVNVFSTAYFSVLVMHLYQELNPAHASSKFILKRDAGREQHGQTALSGRVIIGGAVLLTILAAVTGWLLLSTVDLEDRTEIHAHRGSSSDAPENTLAAVDRAIADGAHWVEIDVQRTADDRVVVAHDRDLMKIGGASLVITETSYAELAMVDIGSWFDPSFADQRIATLEDVLERCRGRIKVNIELKYYGRDDQLAHRVIEIVEETHMVDKIVIMSLKLEAVGQVKSLRPDWTTGLLSTASLGNLTRVHADFLAVHSGMVTPGFVRRVHRAGKSLMVWTVNDTVGMTKYFGMNVDGLITDEPALAVRLLEEREGMDPIERALVTVGLLAVGETEHVDPTTDGI